MTEVEFMYALIEAEGDSSGFDRKFAGWIEREYTVHREDALSMISEEEGCHPDSGKSLKAQQYACFSILTWLTEDPSERGFDHTNLRELTHFVAIHRQACVWAVLVARLNREVLSGKA